MESPAPIRFELGVVTPVEGGMCGRPIAYGPIMRHSISCRVGMLQSGREMGGMGGINVGFFFFRFVW